MRVLEAVHVLRDARVVGPPAEHGGKEGDNAGGLETNVAVIEAVEEVEEGDLVIKLRFFLEGEDPRFLDDGFDECAPIAFDGFDEPLKLDIGGPEALGIGADDVGCVGGDAVVLRLEGGFHSVERPPHMLFFCDCRRRGGCRRGQLSCPGRRSTGEC